MRKEKKYVVKMIVDQSYNENECMSNVEWYGIMRADDTWEQILGLLCSSVMRCLKKKWEV